MDVAWTCGACECSLLALRLCGAHLLDDLFHRGVDAVLFEFAFPDGYGRPAHLSECRHGSAVALDVATELDVYKRQVHLCLGRHSRYSDLARVKVILWQGARPTIQVRVCLLYTSRCV